MPQPSQQPVAPPSNAPKAPPAEVLKGNFDITDSDDAELNLESGPKGDAPKEPVKPDVSKEPPKEEPKEPVVSKEEPKEPKEQKKDEIIEGPSLLKPKKASEARDYSGYSEDEVKALKSMSNEAFNYIAPILKGRKELEKLKEATFLQHPEGYTLHPDFRQGQAMLSHAQREGSAWREQLVKIRQGEEWTPLVGIDPKTGNFIYGEKRKPTVEDEEQVRLAMNRCITVEQQQTTILQQMPQRFEQMVEQDNQAIQAERARRFDWAANPELLKHELETPRGKQSVETIINEFKGLFPVYHQHSIGVQVAADLWVTMQILNARLKEAEAGKAVAETLKEEATRIEPTSKIRPAKSAGNGKFPVKEFNLDGLPS